MRFVSWKKKKKVNGRTGTTHDWIMGINETVFQLASTLCAALVASAIKRQV